MAKVIVTNKVNIPVDKIDLETIEEKYSIRLYEDSACSACPLRPERHCSDCDECVNYKGRLKMYDFASVKGSEYIRLPQGNIKRIEKITGLKSKNWKDLRPYNKFDFKVKAKAKLYTGKTVNGKKTVNQRKIIDKWKETKVGMIKCPPRAGKSLMAVTAMAEVGVKTIIMAHESHLLQQFYEAIMGINGKPKGTNFAKLEKQTGKTLVKIIEKDKDLDNPDLQVALVTYQKFIKEKSAKKRLKKLRKFSLLIVDEYHQASALAYAKVTSKLWCPYRLTLTATDKRKDGLDRIGTEICGPIRAEATVVALKPRVELVETGVTSGKYKYKSWVGFLRFVENSKPRVKLIVKEVFNDLRNGRKAIIIPVEHSSQLTELVRLLNKQAKYNNDNKGENWPEKFAVGYQRGVNKSKILADFDNGNTKVLIGIRKMIKQGIDMSIPDMLYMVIPMSADKVGNAGAPMFKQLSFRVATWTPTKVDPTIKIFVDGVSFSYGCLKSLFFKEILPNLKDKPNKPASYSMNESDFERAMQICKDRNYTPVNEPGERMTSKKILKKIGKEKPNFIKGKRRF